MNLQRQTLSEDNGVAVELIPVPVSCLEFFWPQSKEFIQKVADKTGDDITTDDIFSDLTTKDRQLWVIVRGDEMIAAIVTNVYKYHGKSFGVLSHVGGKDFRSWINAVDPIADFFRSLGCIRFIMIGRRGWEKFLPQFATNRICLEMPLNE